MRILFILGLILLSLQLPAQVVDQGKTLGNPEMSPVLMVDTPPEERWETTVFHDTVAKNILAGISHQAFPGAQLLVAHKGKVVYHQSFGFHTYDSLIPVQTNDVYDLASVTKIAAATPALMKLYEQGKINLDLPFSTYWTPWRQRRDKRDLTLREILAHQGGLEPYIVYLSEIRSRKGLKRRWVRSQPSRRFSIALNDTLYLKTRFHNKMQRMAQRSEVASNKEYRYSGLSFLLYPALVSELSGKTFEEFLRSEIYEPIGATELLFNPLKTLPKERIVPTEVDTLFRGGLVHGSVHDENAALMGGISGNAGLFGTAESLARLLQLYLQKGRYGTHRIFSENTLEEFTRVQYPENDNRRGLGFDKPSLVLSKEEESGRYPAQGASELSFGHAGFTGTFVWVDPANELVYVFLSNRVYPSREYRALYTLRIRERLLQACYDFLQRVEITSISIPGK